jgi:hypothetical protein
MKIGYIILLIVIIGLIAVGIFTNKFLGKRSQIDTSISTTIYTSTVSSTTIVNSNSSTVNTTTITTHIAPATNNIQKLGNVTTININSSKFGRFGVFVINLSTNQVVNLINGTKSSSGEYGGLVLSPSGTTGYTDEQIINISENTVTKVFTHFAYGEFVDNPVIISPNGKFVYTPVATTGIPEDDLLVVNTSSNMVSNVIDLANCTDYVGCKYSFPSYIAVNPSGKYVYVTEGNFTIATNTITNNVSNVIQLNAQPNGLAISPSGTFGYVSVGNNTLIIINLSNYSIIKKIRLENVTSIGNIAFYSKGGVAYLSEPNNAILILNTTTDNITKQIDIATSPFESGISADIGHIIFGPNDSYAYVTGFENISVINTTIGKTVEVIDVCNIPANWDQILDVALNPSGNLAYVMCAQTGGASGA